MNERIWNYVFGLGAVLMVVGALAALLRQPWAAWVFMPGAVAYGGVQLRETYAGYGLVVRRLYRILAFSDLMFLLAGALMMADYYGFLGLDVLTHIKYIHNNWVVAVLIGAVLQLYASFRISHEIGKE